ncbi:hypothetical protein [Flavobacterium sp.]|uniref:hypothetical protein n=1 Tax=Flavobacterium sp. TaxID=239 RepID=UPI002BA13491|nr:hypothetical protein [Flavobacterium sp.]HSD07989.1 hypothetical protein [Flavobacterium sp.]
MDFNSFFQILIASIVATSAMTLFSYAVSESFRELYKEPVLLTFILKSINIEVSDKSKKIIAWLLHYAIGFGFVLAYHFLWSHNILTISIVNAFLLGAISGIIGIIGWVIMFKVSNFKPSIDFKGYYLQLFFAHVIFGLVATFTYSIFNNFI